jgi:PAS domain-containing protein
MGISVTSARAMFDQAVFGVAQASPAGDWQFVNDPFCEIVDHSRQELLASSERHITHFDDSASTDEVVRRLVWAKLCASLVRDHDKRRYCSVLVIEDVTDKITSGAGSQG